MKKKSYAVLAVVAVFGMACAGGVLLGQSNFLNKRIDAHAAGTLYSVTFDKNGWNEEFTENSVVTDQGATLVLKSSGKAQGYTLIEGIDGIASLRGNGVADLYFDFPFQRINSMTVVYEYEDGNTEAANSVKMACNFGTEANSKSNNGGTITSGASKNMTYYSANIYVSMSYNVGSYSTDRVIVKTITVEYYCS